MGKYKTKSYVDTETGELQNGILITKETLLNDEKQRLLDQMNIFW